MSAQGPPARDRSGSLREVRVVPVAERDYARWDDTLCQHHYLGSTGLVGERLRHVAVDRRGAWLALIGWVSAAFKCQARDQWIGWLPTQQWRRLPLVANNARFVILPDARRPHLASRVLALATRRLAADWRQAWGHSVLLAETFIDGTRFAGTCYRAAGWEFLGQTQGFRRSAGRYVAHGQPKLIAVRSLHPRARELLRGAAALTPFLPPETAMDPLALELTGPGSLKAAMAALGDPRKRRGKRHRDFAGLLTLVQMAHLAGMRTYRAIADYVRHVPQAILDACGCQRDMRTGLTKPPSEPTLRRVTDLVDRQALEQVTQDWLKTQRSACLRGAIAIDGKTLRGSYRGATDAAQVVAACTHEGIVLAQDEIVEEGGEIPTAGDLIERLDQEIGIAGCMFTMDALHTQQHRCARIVEKKPTSP